MRVLFVGGTGPVGQAAVPFVLDAGHEVAVAHSGAHEPPALAAIEHLHGERDALLATGGPAERWRPDAIVDTFAGGATAAKARQTVAVARRAGAAQLVAVSSIDVYRHCALAGVDGHEPAVLSEELLPLTEDAPRRTGPSPMGGTTHDNVAMEDALDGVERITVLRPGAIYGPHLHPNVVREWYLVGKVVAGDRRLPLPDGGTQLFHRVALEAVGRAVAAALGRAPAGHWACNVGDARQPTFGALAALVAAELGHQWEPEPVPWAEGDHPWNVRHPVLADTIRLRTVLGVTDPDPLEATRAQIAWLFEHRDAVAAFVG